MPNNNPVPRDPGPRGPGKNHVPGKGGKGKGRGKGPKKGNGPKHYGGYAGYPGVNLHQLNQLINSQMQQILDPIRDERKDVRRDARDQIEAEKNRYKRAVGDINHIYNQTGGYIQGRNAETAKGWDTARANSAANQTALIAQLGLNKDAAVGGVNSELGRLGLGTGGFTDGMNSDANFAGMMANQQGANQTANLDLMSNAAASVGNLLLGMNEGSRGSALGGALNDRTDALNSIKNDRRDAIADINDAIREARSGRKGLLAELLQQLQQTGWGMYVDQQNLSQQQQQINLQRQAQRFAQNQARQVNARVMAGSGASEPGSYGGGGGSSSGGGHSSGVDHGGYYGTNNDLLMGAILGPRKGRGKGRGKKGRR